MQTRPIPSHLGGSSHMGSRSIKKKGLKEKEIPPLLFNSRLSVVTNALEIRGPGFHEPKKRELVKE